MSTLANKPAAQVAMAAKAAALLQENQQARQGRSTFSAQTPKKLAQQQILHDRQRRYGTGDKDDGDGDDPAANSAPRKKIKSLAAKRAAVAPANAARRQRAPLAPVPVHTEDDLSSLRLLSRPEILDITGVSYALLWQMMREGRFPRSRAFGGRTVWVQSEIDAWIKSLPLRALKGDAGNEGAAC